MQPFTIISRAQIIYILTIALMCTLFFLAWAWQHGYNINEGGFLWYGVQRVLAGEVPLRDFKSYDPTRYYWSAGLMYLMDSSGLLALRFSIGLLRFICLVLCLRLLLKSNITDKYSLLIAAIFFSLWMERLAQYDIFAVILLFSALLFTLENPSPKRYFFLGIAIGFIATIGRNHGVYGIIASIGVMAYLKYVNSAINYFQCVKYWMAGILVGYLPIIGMMIFIPSFENAFINSLFFSIEAQTIDLTLPIPLSRIFNFSADTKMESIAMLGGSLFFILLAAAAVGGLFWIFFNAKKLKNMPPIFVVSFVTLIPYTHFAFFRADIPHLSRGIFPLLIGMITYILLKPSSIKWPAITLLLLLSIPPTLLAKPSTQCRLMGCVGIKFSNGDLVYMDQQASQKLKFIQSLINAYSPQKRNFIVAPYGAGIYSSFFVKSPVWTNNTLFPRSESFQLDEIERIKTTAPDFILIDDISLDEVEDRRYRKIQPLVYEYIITHFVRVDDFPNKPEHSLLFVPIKTDAL
jgi:hypothetical protein